MLDKHISDCLLAKDKGELELCDRTLRASFDRACSDDPSLEACNSKNLERIDLYYSVRRFTK